VDFAEGERGRKRTQSSLFFSGYIHIAKNAIGYYKLKVVR
jgi:hypothetical protein